MSNFSIKVDAIKNEVDRIESISNTLANIHNRLDCITVQAEINVMKQPLKVLCSEVESVKRCTISLENSLNQIVQIYEAEEDKISKTATTMSSAYGSDAYAVTEQNYTTENGTRFKIGKPEQPQWEVYKQYDNDFAYDSNAKATFKDYANWAKWKVLNEGAQHAGWVFNRNMPDAIEAYEHYRAGDGTDLEIDYAKAYREDKNIKKVVDQHIRDTQQMVENMIAGGQQPPFSITGDLMPVSKPYPNTENWQKTIGAHQIWISADVTVDINGQIHMDTTVHEIDRYNFNSGMVDIASGASDNENGRFEQLGWAKSFNTTGQTNFDVSWNPGEIQSGTSQQITSGGR